MAAVVEDAHLDQQQRELGESGSGSGPCTPQQGGCLVREPTDLALPSPARPQLPTEAQRTSRLCVALAPVAVSPDPRQLVGTAGPQSGVQSLGSVGSQGGTGLQVARYRGPHINLPRVPICPYSRPRSRATVGC